MITLFVGDVTRYLSDIAFSHDPTAKLITDKNFENISPGTYYTSIGDMSSLTNFGKLLQQADKIIYAPPPNNQWSSGNSMQEWTEDYLKTFSCKIKIENYQAPEFVSDSSKVLLLSDKRKTDNPQVWVAGCSVSHGVGVKKFQRYGQILSDRLGLEVSFLTHGGSSITWAADQILRSDIRKNDIVVWGLTSGNRVTYFTGDKLCHVNAPFYSLHPEFAKILGPDTLDSPNNFYHNLTSIHQVINFSKLIEAQLVVAALLHSNEMHYIKDLPNFILLASLWGRNLKESFLDLGDDDAHPGPLTHLFYADKIYNKLLSE